MAQTQSARSFPEVLTALVGDLSGLFRKEIQLARAETSEKLAQVIGGARTLAIGAVLGIGAVGVLFAAIVAAIGGAFIAWGMEPNWANALASLIVAVVFGVIAFSMINSGIESMKAENLVPERTAQSLARDAEAVKERL